MARACPVCGSAAVLDRGPIMHPVPTLVAGVPIDLNGARFCLARCEGCGFCFKDPPIPEERLLRCYREARGDHWGEDPDPRRRRFDQLVELAARHAPGRRVLDVGCFNGAMLAQFGSQWERFGVEPSSEAAQMAERRGVRILGAQLESVPPGLRFDAIMAVDVLEHMPAPLAFFRAVRERLVPGGVFVAVTGDTGAFSWRLEGSAYWYCSLVEHVSFYDQRSMGELARRSGMASCEHTRRPHGRSGLAERTLEMGKNALYIAMRRTGGLGVPALRRLFVDRRAPGWLTASDHMFHVMKRIP
jgi:SAM-dependent methyltransferase